MSNLHTLALRATLDDLDAVAGGGTCPGKVDHPVRIAYSRGAHAIHRDNGELARLELLAHLRRQVDEAIAQAVIEARRETGYSRGPLQPWENIAAVLGVTKQAAAKRFGDGRTHGKDWPARVRR